MVGCDPRDGRVRERGAVGAVPVEGDPADGGPSLGENAVLRIGREDGGLAEVRVDLDLVDGRDDVC